VLREDARLRECCGVTPDEAIPAPVAERR
jgi:hypothetical protein